MAWDISQECGLPIFAVVGFIMHDGIQHPIRLERLWIVYTLSTYTHIHTYS